MARVLIVEDEPDLRELMQYMLESLGNATVWPAQDGKDALDIIGKRGMPDVIFSDYNMPIKNGGQLFTEVRSLSETVPFVLVSSDPITKFAEFKGAKNVFGLEKPFSPEALINLLEKAIELRAVADASPAPEMKSAPASPYHSVEMDVLVKLGRSPVSLYLKLSENNYLKVLNEFALFTEEEKNRYQAKGAKSLWIESALLKEFLKAAAKEIFAKINWAEASLTQGVSTLAVNHSLINTASQAFGWSQEVIDCATKNVQTALAFAEKNPDLKAAVDLYRDKKSMRLSTHSVILAVATVAAIRKLGWDSNLSAEKLCFAAVIHDMSLTEDFFANKVTLLSEANPFQLPESPEKTMLLSHAKTAAAILANWPSCPPDVDTIVLQHHERPDGSGFPGGLMASRISPLAAVFIVCEDLIYNCFENFNQDPKQYFATRKEYYSRGEFKKVYDAVMASLS